MLKFWAKQIRARQSWVENEKAAITAACRMDFTVVDNSFFWYVSYLQWQCNILLESYQIELQSNVNYKTMWIVLMQFVLARTVLSRITRVCQIQPTC